MVAVRRAVTVSRTSKTTRIGRPDMAASVSVKNGRLAIDAELDSKGRDSASGKTTVHYTTGGFVAIDGSEYKVSVTVTKAKRKAVKA